MITIELHECETSFDWYRVIAKEKRWLINEGYGFESYYYAVKSWFK